MARQNAKPGLPTEGEEKSTPPKINAINLLQQGAGPKACRQCKRGLSVSPRRKRRRGVRTGGGPSRESAPTVARVPCYRPLCRKAPKILADAFQRKPELTTRLHNNHAPSISSRHDASCLSQSYEQIGHRGNKKEHRLTPTSSMASKPASSVQGPIVAADLRFGPIARDRSESIGCTPSDSGILHVQGTGGSVLNSARIRWRTQGIRVGLDGTHEPSTMGL